MKWSSLKFCFGISFLCHAALFGVVAFGGFATRKPAIQQEDALITLTLIAAPEETQAKLPTVEVIAPAPIQPVQPQKPVEIPVPVEPLKQPTLPEPQPIVSVPQTSPVVSTAATTAQTEVRGDGSSVKPERDLTTIQAQPGVEAKPNYLKNPEPVYPESARRRRQEGLVLLTVNVTAQGRAANVEIKKSSGFSLLDNAAILAVRGWEFEPARLNSVSIASQIEVPVRFKLTE